MKTVDLFLRTYPNDYQWLTFLFRSMIRHVRGFRTLILIYPQGQVSPLGLSTWWHDLIHNGVISNYKFGRADRTYPDDYVGQQVTKLRCHEYTDADEVCFLDSDIVFVRGFTPESRRPQVVECRPWDAVGRAQCWYQPTKILLREEPLYETMARHPFQYPTALIKRCYEHVGGEAGLLGFGAHFSEFNLLGNYALNHAGYAPFMMSTGDSTQEKREDDWVQQFWSHNLRLKPDMIEAKMRELGYWDENAREL